MQNAKDLRKDVIEAVMAENPDIFNALNHYINQCKRLNRLEAVIWDSLIVNNYNLIVEPVLTTLEYKSQLTFYKEKNEDKKAIIINW